MIQRRTILQASAIFLGASALAAPALASYKNEYRLSLPVGPGTTWYQGAENFARLVAEKTDKRINIKVYPGSSLVQGAQDRELTALRQGLIDVLVGTTVNWSGTVKDFNAFSLPFTFPSEKAVDAVLQSDALNQDFYNIVRKAGMEPLASAEYGFIQPINSKRDLRAEQDFKGLKMRVVATPIQQEVMQAFGANPTTMSFADVQAALSTGAVDGLTLTEEQFLVYKFHTAGLKHLTRANLYNELIHFNIANPVWKSWSPEDQEKVREAAKEAAEQMTASVRAAYRSNDAALKAVGVEVVELTPEEQAAWIAATRPVYDKWKKQTNPALIDKIEAAINTP
ncbi:C4-dicarboxylate ABC transporter [Lampropedia aestuarii]|uniref:C4-dicarboxylate ABC transporter n=1 Tax=Lampropedia aestuarii TaxID=2562762 RepID=A0A4S5BEV7_9BURK|nr:TRAP transporter substrate-binding protein DctP [Lampropedia aestuarii]THJ30730.1 C4-dicarboxylate ABC transporter [Lampropedia aestuarii]